MELDTYQLMKPFGQHFAMTTPTTTVQNYGLLQPKVPTPEMAQGMIECDPRVRLVFQGFHGHTMPMPTPVSYPDSMCMPFPLQGGYPRSGFPTTFLCREEPKPQYSYIGLIAMAILSSKEKKLILGDIYQWILDNYVYFRQRGPGWKNSIRHNLSLNDCFIKSSRSVNGKGHFWAIHEANLEDFKKGDFRRRRAQNKVRKAMGLEITDNDDDDSPCASPAVGSPGINWQGSTHRQHESPQNIPMYNSGPNLEHSNKYNEDPKPLNFSLSGPSSAKNIPAAHNSELTQSPYPVLSNSETKEPDETFVDSTILHHPGLHHSHQVMSYIQSPAKSQERPRKKRAFDVESLLAPDDTEYSQFSKRQCQQLTQASSSDI